MIDAIDGFVIEGRSADVTGHGTSKWSISVADLALGRPVIAGLRAFKGRPALAKEILPALRDFSKVPLARSSFKTGLHHLQSFWKFLDEMQMASAATGGAFLAPRTVFEIPGVVWALFKDWLDAQATNGQHYTYFFCKRAFDRSASLLDPVRATQCGYPLPLNPFPNPQKALARAGRSEDYVLEPDTVRAVAEVLFKQVSATTRRIQVAREQALADKERPIGAMRNFYDFAVSRNWMLKAVSGQNGGFCDLQPAKSNNGVKRLAGRALWFVPSQDDLMPAFCLVMLRTGWNTSTTRDMNADDWARDHPTRPAQLVQLVSAKGRARGRVQSSYSNRHKAAHPYQVVRAVLNWNQPLRDGLRAAEERLSAELEAENLDGQARQRLESEVARLRRLRKRVWLYLTSAGAISHLDEHLMYDHVNALFADAGILHRGSPLAFSQELSRTTWAMFAYQTSGYNAVVTQLALGHKDLSSLLHYLDQKSVRNRHRRAFFDFQSHVLGEVSRGRLHPRLLKALVERGQVSKEEAAHLAKGGTRSRQGIVCANPFSPDRGLVPDHKQGTACTMQYCLDGCSKAFATIDCLEYVAIRILELRRLEAEMPLLAWVSSDYPHDLQFLEQLYERFSENNRREAMAKAQAASNPLIFTQPSAASLARAR